MPPGRFDPEPILRRAERRTAQGVSVDLAALSAAEANALVGFDITKAGIQPVWVRVRNLERVRYYIPPISIDDDYFSPHEVAWKGHRWFDPAGNRRLDQHLGGLDLPEAVEPGGMVGGYVFTNRDEGLKYANVELVAPGQRKVRRFPFLAKVPGLRTDFQRVNWQHLMAPGRQQDLEEPGLRRWLAELPCCTLGGDRRTPADPLNIVLIGSVDTVLPPLAHAGVVPTGPPLSLLAGVSAVPIWAAPGHCLTKSAGQRQPAQPHAALVGPCNPAGPAGVGGTNQP
jgi:hypothetical protein